MQQLFKERGKILFYILFIFAPLAFWLLEAGDQFITTDFYNTATTIGKMAGIVGVCFFAANIFLSGRYTFIDKFFGGLDQVYLFHRKVGITAFTLLTIHLIAMTFRNLPYGWQAVWDFI